MWLCDAKSHDVWELVKMPVWINASLILIYLFASHFGVVLCSCVDPTNMFESLCWENWESTQAEHGKKKTTEKVKTRKGFSIERFN